MVDAGRVVLAGGDGRGEAMTSRRRLAASRAADFLPRAACARPCQAPRRVCSEIRRVGHGDWCCTVSWALGSKPVMYKFRTGPNRTAIFV
jgi:hypothetical protein